MLTLTSRAPALLRAHWLRVDSIPVKTADYKSIQPWRMRKDVDQQGADAYNQSRDDRAKLSGMYGCFLW